MADSIEINERFTINGREITISLSRSGGPGGQHVNTTDTRVQLRWSLSTNTQLTGERRKRFIEQNQRWITKDGDVLVVVSEHRSQHENLRIAREKLRHAIRKALILPKKRVATKPTRASKKRRVEGKKRRSKVKANRGKVRHHD